MSRADEAWGGATIRSTLMAAAFAGSLVPGPPRVVENTKMAIRVLQLRHPGVAWREPALRADFTGDHIPDLAIMGVNPTMLAVALIIGPVDGGSKTVRLWWEVGGDDLEASCIRDASLEMEELEFQERQGVKGLRLSAPPCDVFHLVWDSPSGNLAWWR